MSEIDLIVRTVEPLSSPMNDDIRRIFVDACELTGMKGAVGFQSAPPDFIEVAPKAVVEAHLGTWA